MESGLNPQDKKDLDKFIKFFALKVRTLLFTTSDEVYKSATEVGLISDL